jgi:hypothetical protein
MDWEVKHHEDSETEVTHRHDEFDWGVGVEVNEVHDDVVHAVNHNGAEEETE